MAPTPLTALAIRLWTSPVTRGVGWKRFRRCVTLRIPISLVIGPTPCRESLHACRYCQQIPFKPPMRDWAVPEHRTPSRKAAITIAGRRGGAGAPPRCNLPAGRSAFSVYPVIRHAIVVGSPYMRVGNAGRFPSRRP